MAIRNLIFDWSGTLINDLPPVLAATNAIFQHYGMEAWTEEQFRDRFYLPFPDFYREWLPEASLQDLELHYHRAFRDLQGNVYALPAAHELLEYARSADMKLFLLSSVHTDHWQVQADKLGLRNYFTATYCGALDKRKTIFELLASHDLLPSETLFIGDMRHDIDTAHHAGVRSCAVLTGYDSLARLKLSCPELLFRDLHGVLGFLKRHRPGTPGGDADSSGPGSASPLEKFPIATVGAAIFKPGTDLVLMVRTYKWSNLWGIPGGKIKRGETALEALRRETLEETGLALDEIQYVETQDCIDCEEFFRPAHFLLMNYCATARPVSDAAGALSVPAVVLNDEADEYRWLPVSTALEELPLNTPTRHLLETLQRTGYPTL